MRLFPEGVTEDARALFWGRGLRALGDGFISLLLPVYLGALGFGTFEIGVLVMATLLGSAVATLLVGFVADRFGRRTLLIVAALLMIGTGIGFLLEERFWPLVAIAFIGTLNPTAGDVSLFLPLEHALLAGLVPDRSRTAVFAFYGLIGALAGAVGSLMAGLPELLRLVLPMSFTSALQAMFALYTVLGLAIFHLYRRLPATLDRARGQRQAPLGPSRRMVFTLAAVFSLDSFAGGLLVQSLLALWLFQHFGLSLAGAGSIFFWTGLLGACSQPVAAWLARRIGLINTMVFTHLPSSLCTMAVPFAPDLGMAVVLLLVRGLLAQMDVPARTSYVMAVVTPAERPAASSVTLLPRALASAAGPLLTGYLLALSSFGWPVFLGGALKAAYDLTMLFMFRRHRPPEEREPGTA